MIDGIEAEAVLCEDFRAVMIYLYRGEALIRVASQPLPIAITEDAFELVRQEWEQAWARAELVAPPSASRARE